MEDFCSAPYPSFCIGFLNTRRIQDLRFCSKNCIYLLAAKTQLNKNQKKRKKKKGKLWCMKPKAP